MPRKPPVAVDYERLYLAERERYDALLDRYHALRMSGGTAAPATVERPMLDPVQQAIRARASKLPMGARAHAMQAMGVWAASERAKQSSDIDIIMGLERGVNISDDDLPPRTEDMTS